MLFCRKYKFSMSTKLIKIIKLFNFTAKDYQNKQTISPVLLEITKFGVSVRISSLKTFYCQ